MYRPNSKRREGLSGKSKRTMTKTFSHLSDCMYFATERASLASRACNPSSGLKSPSLLVLSSLPISRTNEDGQAVGQGAGFDLSSGVGKLRRCVEISPATAPPSADCPAATTSPSPKTNLEIFSFATSTIPSAQRHDVRTSVRNPNPGQR